MGVQFIIGRRFYIECYKSFVQRFSQHGCFKPYFLRFLPSVHRPPLSYSCFSALSTLSGCDSALGGHLAFLPQLAFNPEASPLTQISFLHLLKELPIQLL